MKSSRMCIERLHFSTSHEVLEFSALQMAAFLVESELVGYQEGPPIFENQAELQQSNELFYGFFWQESNERILVGAISYTKDGDNAIIKRVIVQPNYFRRGIAKALLAFVIEDLCQSGCREVEVIAASQNTPAICLYTQIGFQASEQQLLEQGIALTVFKKNLLSANRT